MADVIGAMTSSDSPVVLVDWQDPAGSELSLVLALISQLNPQTEVRFQSPRSDRVAAVTTGHRCDRQQCGPGRTCPTPIPQWDSSDGRWSFMRFSTGGVSRRV
ncbi:hypothetical protein ASQ49_08240 [Acidipropionibacterium acidipropionici]|nr:hypothetical protein ASQ49_08240 [Acidipropionibacterium acidipropionici]APZ08997.1 hypothetical protein BWX38_06675 [Acidipropionibacterium acidipropionici]